MVKCGVISFTKSTDQKQHVNKEQKVSWHVQTTNKNLNLQTECPASRWGQVKYMK